ncbi:hypothetical protein G7Z17_g10063 [Cylindrodendrum hubeiense]|uniref:DUF202 domain-containing protein n=1 Tax=Cylindrodendrum hubeiense TaxID=595255 RepID=A0A9P5LBK9_9HYPO|nr:hypothetical protein G7Z17_g10063 [Cylindrodendrum hubeiense]
MHSQGRPRSNSAISLDELDLHSHSRVNHSSSSSGSHGPPSQDQDRDQDQDDHRHEHDPSEPRGAGSAGTAGSEPGDRSETPPPWRKMPVSRLTSAWGSHVSCEVEFASARDHLAVERTFLGYLRTSVMMSMLGTALAQLSVIADDGPGFGYTLAGKPLASACFAFSIATILLGALLFVFFGFMTAIDAVQASPEG